MNVTVRGTEEFSKFLALFLLLFSGGTLPGLKYRKFPCQYSAPYQLPKENNRFLSLVENCNTHSTIHSSGLAGSLGCSIANANVTNTWHENTTNKHAWNIPKSQFKHLSTNWKNIFTSLVISSYFPRQHIPISVTASWFSTRTKKNLSL